MLGIIICPALCLGVPEAKGDLSDYMPCSRSYRICTAVLGPVFWFSLSYIVSSITSSAVGSTVTQSNRVTHFVFPFEIKKKKTFLLDVLEVKMIIILLLHYNCMTFAVL